jgi:hypothetical protein
LGVHAPDEGDVHQAGEHQIVDVAAAAGEEPRIVCSQQQRAHLRHARESSTIDRTVD